MKYSVDIVRGDGSETINLLALNSVQAIEKVLAMLQAHNCSVIIRSIFVRAVDD